MDWLKHATAFKLPLGDAPQLAQAYIQKLKPENGGEMWCVFGVIGSKKRLANDGSGWIDDPRELIRVDMAKAIPEREKELDEYRRRYTFETKEQALDMYVAWRRAQGDVSYRP